MKLIIQFILGIGVGLYGYLMPGYINLSVLQLGTQKMQQAIWKTLIIVSLIEIPYCFLCMSGMNWIMSQHLFIKIVQWAIVVVLLLVALQNIVAAKKITIKKELQTDKKIDANTLNKLLLFAILNPFQLSAWAIWGTYFIEKTWFTWTPFSIALFSIGASIGVFIILWFYAFMGQKLVTYFSLNQKNVNYIVSGILIVLAIVQIVRNLS